jgi:ElaA protein
MPIEWILKKFDELTPHELYAILQLRNEVFVVEQHCVFQDADNKDQDSYHFMGWDKKQLIAYTRIVPPGVIYKQVSIGRVVISPGVRGSGIGKELMERSIETINQLFGKADIKIGAQLHLQQFYSSFGFQKASNVYLEDGIEHIEMIRPAATFS